MKKILANSSCTIKIILLHNTMDFIAKMDLNSLLQFLAQNKTKVLAASAVSTALLYGAYFFKRPRNLPPGPLGYPYIGSLKELSGDISGDFTRLGKKYGDLFCLWMGGDRYVLVLNSLDVMKEALVSRGSDFADREPFTSLGDFNLIEPLFNASYNDDQKACRKTSMKYFRKFISTKMKEVLLDEISKLGEIVDNARGKAIGLQKPLDCILTNMFSSIHYDRTYPFGHPELEIMIKGITDWYEAFEDAYGLCFIGHTIFRKTPMDGKEYVRDYSTNCVQVKIKEHAATLDRDNPRDIVDVFLIEGALERFGLETFANLIMELVPNGVNTASITLTWMFYYLQKNPEYQDKILKEITNLKDTSTVSLEDKPKLPLTEAFMLEALRLSSPLQLSMINKPKSATQLRGYDIPRNVSIVCNLAGVHSDPKYYPDPKAFKPERFIKDGVLHVSDSFIPFGMGRRLCIADQLMKNSLFFIWASIIQQFKITPADENVNITYANNLVAKINNYKVILERRL